MARVQPAPIKNQPKPATTRTSNTRILKRIVLGCQWDRPRHDGSFEFLGVMPHETSSVRHMQITTGATNLYGLFYEKGTASVSVPSFQRNYSWTDAQVEQFLADVYASAEDNEPHFWGPIVVLRHPQKPTNLEIIDGQQRISTTIILLSLLRDQANVLTNRIINEGTPGSFDIAPAVRNFLFRPPLYSQTRFSGSYLIDDVLQKYVLADSEGRPKLTKRGAKMSPATKKQTKELRAAYLTMSDSLEKKIGALTENDKKDFVFSVFNALTITFEIHTMELSNEDDAYLLFESLNDRGLRLNPSDLLKTFTLREIRNSSSGPNLDEEIENALKDWDETVSNLGDYDFTKFLRHYLLTLTDDKVQAGKIFAEFKKRIGSLGKLGALKNLKSLNGASENYATLLGSPKERDFDPELLSAFGRMNRYSDTHRVFLLGMLECELDIDSQQLLTRAVEYLSFRWIGAGRNAQDLETLYQTQVRGLVAEPTSSKAKAVAEELIKAAPDDKALEELTRSESTELQRYVLRRIESSTGGAVAGVPNIEHLAPQSPADNDNYWLDAVAKFETDARKEDPNVNGPFYEDFMSNWGNLTLLEDGLNKSIKNLRWPKKLSGVGKYKGISASNYNINSHIVTMLDWTADDILRRERWIKKCISELVSSKWVNGEKVKIEMWDGK